MVGIGTIEIPTGTQREYLNFSFLQSHPTAEPDSWEALLNVSYDAIDYNDEVTIKRDGTPIFKGYVDTKEARFSDEGQLLYVSGPCWKGSMARRLIDQTMTGKAISEEEEDIDVDSGFFTNCYPEDILRFMIQTPQSDPPRREYLGLYEDPIVHREGEGIWKLGRGLSGMNCWRTQIDWTVTFHNGTSGSSLCYAIDRRNDSNWWSKENQTAGMYIKIDLGGTYDLCGIRIECRPHNEAIKSEFMRNYKIELSADDSTYYQVASKTGNTARDVVHGWDPTAADKGEDKRYIKITLTANYPQKWAITNIYVYKASGKPAESANRIPLTEGSVSAFKEMVNPINIDGYDDIASIFQRICNLTQGAGTVGAIDEVRFYAKARLLQEDSASAQVYLWHEPTPTSIDVDKAVDGAIEKAWSYNGNTSTFTDETTDINDGDANDVQLPPIQITSTGDTIYFGSDNIFRILRINVGTAGVYSGVTLQWQYWNGSAWTALSVSDGTNGFQNAGKNNVSFTKPADWVKNDVNGATHYWVRCVVTDLSTPSLTTAPLGTQSWLAQINWNAHGVEVPYLDSDDDDTNYMYIPAKLASFGKVEEFTFADLGAYDAIDLDKCVLHVKAKLYEGANGHPVQVQLKWSVYDGTSWTPVYVSMTTSTSYQDHAVGVGHILNTPTKLNAAKLRLELYAYFGGSGDIGGIRVTYAYLEIEGTAYTAGYEMLGVITPVSQTYAEYYIDVTSKMNTIVKINDAKIRFKKDTSAFGIRITYAYLKVTVGGIPFILPVDDRENAETGWTTSGTDPWIDSDDGDTSYIESSTANAETTADYTLTDLDTSGYDGREWEWWADTINKTWNFGMRRGSDLSDSVEFKYDSSHLASKFMDIENRGNVQGMMNRIKVIGGGSAEEQEMVTSDWHEDETSINAYGLYEGIINEPAVDSKEAADKYAEAVLKEYKHIRKTVRVEVHDTYPSNTWGVADEITLTDTHTGLSGKYRVMSVKRNYDENGESVTIVASDSSVYLPKYKPEEELEESKATGRPSLPLDPWRDKLPIM